MCAEMTYNEMKRIAIEPFGEVCIHVQYTQSVIGHQKGSVRGHDDSQTRQINR